MAEGDVAQPSDLSGVPERWREAVRSALVVDARSRTPDAEVLLSQLRDPAKDRLLIDSFEAYDVINDRYVVLPEGGGEGGIARVYRVDDQLDRRQYAAKFVKPEAENKIDSDAEFLLVRDLPPHPSIVLPTYLQQATSVRRGEAAYELRGVFMLSPWVEGIRLDLLMRSEAISRVRALEIALALAEALDHVQRHGIFHRDVKPQNVIIRRDGRPQLVDFNVGRTVERAGETRVGTPGYVPPDLEACGWGSDSDAYALGVTLAEMLAGRFLGESAHAWVTDGARMPTPLADVLRKGTAPTKSDRFADSAELAEALRTVLEALRRPPEFAAQAPFPTASDEELARENWNPYQNWLLTLFSQSNETNKGTRGLDDFDRWAYVPTRVDKELYADIAGGRFKLVVITGNAGDGKTAFVQMLQQRLTDDGGDIVFDRTGNAATVTYEGRRLVTNLDGSQDEGDRSNDEVLVAFFAPFAGALPAPPDGETRVIAINEGRLIDFVGAHTDQFDALDRAVMNFVTESSYQLPEWLLIVNLNLRALTIGEPSQEGDQQGDSLTAEILKRFSDERVWSPCASCVAHDHCYARANAATLRDPVFGPRAAERIRQTLDLVRLRRRMHITMRDLRSALAYAVAGTRRCDEIVALAESVGPLEPGAPLAEGTDAGAARALLSGHLYNALFAASDHDRENLDDAARRDRLLRTAAAVDVARTANPDDDAQLWRFESIDPSDPQGLVRTDRQLLEQLRGALPVDPRLLSAARADVAFVHATLRRKLFLEREDPQWVEMFPYRRLTDFQRQLIAVSENDREAVIRAISNSEGLYSQAFAGQLAVRLVADSTGSDRSYVPHPTDDFRLAPLDRAEAARYVEYEPDSLRLVHVSHPEVSLDINLDLFETLMRILRGHTPSREELRGAWLDLRVFKERVASLPSDTLLLSKDDTTFHCVARSNLGLQVEAVA